MDSDNLKQDKKFFIFDWFIALQQATGKHLKKKLNCEKFMQKCLFAASSIANHEKLILYVCCGVLFALVYILSMLVIKQYIQRRNLYKKLKKLDIHEYQPLPARIESQTKSTSNLKLNKNKSSTITAAPNNNNNNNNASPKIKKSGRVSKSSTNLYNQTDSSSSGNYDKYSKNNFNNQINDTFGNSNNNNANGFAKLSHNNLYNYNNNNNEINNNFDENFEGFKLITRNGSTKIVNGTNDDISEYEIPIIRYNERSLMQQYSSHMDN